MTDLFLAFPPQWSPFQPALSLPSLSAWLRRDGFSVRSVDFNVEFYDWILSEECAGLLLECLGNREWEDEVTAAYEVVLSSAADFRRDLDDLRHLDAPRHRPDTTPKYVQGHFRGVQSIETYLSAVSAISEAFTLSPYEFRLSIGNLDASRIEREIRDPHPVVDRFVERMVERICEEGASLVGLSCIGQEQLYFTLLLGDRLKRRIAAPVMVGGTIFARMQQRGALPPDWFGRHFDIIVCNEGERPCTQMLTNLAAGRDLRQGTPSIVYRNHEEVVTALPAAPLKPHEIPVPDFDDMPLGRYLSAEITLPLLSARGCYWGKCEFCHHYMVYGGEYAAYEVEQVLETVSHLHARYGVSHFAFNDEAIPPKVMRSMGQTFPPHETSGWTFTGLIKFERYFQRDDFVRLRDVGFRSLYVGLESASERVLALMKKNNTQETMLRNLRDATSSGIWMHCFLFFGFPGECDDDARETYDFILEHADSISSFGSATFVLEHNAPIFHHLDDFAIELRESAKDDVDVYYLFEVGEGITPERALEWMERLNSAALDIPKYNAAGWVPRELQLCLLSVMSPDRLVDEGLRIRDRGGLPDTAPVADVLTVRPDPHQPGRRLAVNRLNGKVLAVRGAAAELLELCRDEGVTLGAVQAQAPAVFERLTSASRRLTSEAVSSPVPAPL